MRSIALLILTLFPIALSQVVPDSRHKACNPWDPTRDHPSCACLPGFDDPGKPEKQCLCPDEQNTRLIVEGDTAFCQCLGGGQSKLSQKRFRNGWLTFQKAFVESLEKCQCNVSRILFHVI